VPRGPGVRPQNGRGRERGGATLREGKGQGTITRSDMPRRTMRCNSLYPVEGEPAPILATKRRRLNSHDRSHYLLSRISWRCRGGGEHPLELFSRIRRLNRAHLVRYCALLSPLLPRIARSHRVVSSPSPGRRIRGHLDARPYLSFNDEEDRSR